MRYLRIKTFDTLNRCKWAMECRIARITPYSLDGILKWHKYLIVLRLRGSR